jgi:hypothetical protein
MWCSCDTLTEFVYLSNSRYQFYFIFAYPREINQSLLKHIKPHGPKNTFILISWKDGHARALV